VYTVKTEQGADFMFQTNSREVEVILNLLRSNSVDGFRRTLVRLKSYQPEGPDPHRVVSDELS